MSTETFCSASPAPYVCPKRPVKKTYVYQKRPVKKTDVYQKSPVKETYVYQKSSVTEICREHIDVNRDFLFRFKRALCVSKEPCKEIYVC